MIGCHTMIVKKENFNAVKTMLKAIPAAKATAFLASMANQIATDELVQFVGFFWQRSVVSPILCAESA